MDRGPDDEVRARLHRPDIFPAGDLALRHAVGRRLPATGVSIPVEP